jgi:hypothetical protein
MPNTKGRDMSETKTPRTNKAIRHCTRDDFEGMACKAIEIARQLETELAEAHSRLSEIAKAHKVVMSERCPADEVHCTCVPILREELTKAKVARNRAERERAKAEADYRELRALFDLQHKHERDVEAVRLWNKLYSPHKFVMPDRGDMVTFLMDQLHSAVASLKEAREIIEIEIQNYGKCDHDVGICICGMKSVLADIIEIINGVELEKTKEAEEQEQT